MRFIFGETSSLLNNRMKLHDCIALLTFFCCITSGTEAQRTWMQVGGFRYVNSVQLEVGGHGGLYSISFERMIRNRARLKASLQAGVGAWPSMGIGSTYFDPELAFPAIVIGKYSFRKHHIELAAGYTRFLLEQYGYGTGRIGYRLQKPDGRFTFRIAFTPFMEYWGSRYRVLRIYPWGGISLGYNFGLSLYQRAMRDAIHIR